ncbi:hypothetical protein EDEG_01729 [Edhazardia aedis USNM 41457]|uniref:Uncharacterized protein n=1 Tax=Edhazardia aedis (strain USNM 41457) TaxID=1003232 RepID=J9DRK4_EDHAE|nr:hypothetical protein EDEG_01729 [Edhazardia aedis USNM 41457]|eukprot:EJW03962.1 hypothetical protein EDEG_01729 [Edhazardia aedis USNM 41457]
MFQKSIKKMIKFFGRPIDCFIPTIEMSKKSEIVVENEEDDSSILLNNNEVAVDKHIEEIIEKDKLDFNSNETPPIQRIENTSLLDGILVGKSSKTTNNLSYSNIESSLLHSSDQNEFNEEVGQDITQYHKTYVFSSTNEDSIPSYKALLHQKDAIIEDLNEKIRKLTIYNNKLLTLSKSLETDLLVSEEKIDAYSSIAHEKIDKLINENSFLKSMLSQEIEKSELSSLHEK